MTEKKLDLEKGFNCSVKELFEAWSKPEIMKKWFFAGQEMTRNSTVNSRFSVDGVYNVTMHFEDNSVTLYGVYKEIEESSKIVFTWNSPIVKETLVKLDFQEVSSDHSKLILTHTGLPDDGAVDSHEVGWNRCLCHLEKMIEAS